MAVPLTVGALPPPQPLPTSGYSAGSYPTSPYAGTPTYSGPTFGSWGSAFPQTGGDVVPATDPYTTQTGGGQVNTATGPIGPSGGVDWTSMIGGSYEVAQAEAMMAAQMARARDAFTGDIRSAFVNLGYTGDQGALGNLSQYLDQDTIQNAINNKYSLYNQITNAATKSNATNNATLAGRGILESGQTAKSASDVLHVSEQNRYDALRSFLQQGSTGLTHLGDVEAGLAQAVMQARFAAAQRLASMYPMGQPGTGGSTGGGGTTTPDWASVEPYGSYQGGWMVPGGYSESGEPYPYYVAPGSGLGGLGGDWSNTGLPPFHV